MAAGAGELLEDEPDEPDDEPDEPEDGLEDEPDESPDFSVLEDFSVDPVGTLALLDSRLSVR